MPQAALRVRAFCWREDWMYGDTLKSVPARGYTLAGLCAFIPSDVRGGKEVKNKALYLSDEDAVLLHQVVVVVTPRQQLPHLSPQRLGDPAPHQRRQRLRPHAQVEVPACAQRDCYHQPNTKKRVHEQQPTCTIKRVKWQEFQDSPYVARLSEIQVMK